MRSGCVFGISHLLVLSTSEFQKDKWTSDINKRYEMVEDVQHSHRLVGLTQNEVTVLLSEPNYKGEEFWQYYIGMTPRLIPIDGDALSLQFSNGKVVRYLIHET
ncbi:hypothetical protein SAMN06269173_10599 [Hymenobacter mucosus]|uniref:SmpA / OmlA family protein n=1 Tax=Hymenobacter mucosus TaxID=1411120 RepID=A0A238YB06_9BACT|nr:hypothetical protein SAMN06269173_10599 [Hymenobacter mucosus]